MKPCTHLVVFSIILLTRITNAANAPDFNLPTPEGRRINLRTLLREGPVLLEFWATWCKPCLKSLPELEKIYIRYKASGLTVLGVNEDGPRGHTKIKPFLKSRNITFPTVIDSDGSVKKRMQVIPLPTTLLIKQNGEIILRQIGYLPNQEQLLVKAIKSILPFDKTIQKQFKENHGEK